LVTKVLAEQRVIYAFIDCTHIHAIIKYLMEYDEVFLTEDLDTQRMFHEFLDKLLERFCISVYEGIYGDGNSIQKTIRKKNYPNTQILISQLHSKKVKLEEYRTRFAHHLPTAVPESSALKRIDILNLMDDYEKIFKVFLSEIPNTPEYDDLEVTDFDAEKVLTEKLIIKMFSSLGKELKSV
jgi:hypothetical protein